MASGADFDYLNQLFNETYPSGESSYPALTTEKKSDASVAQRAAEAVKENPEIVAAPTSILAVGLLAGYMFNVRKKSPSSGILGEERKDESDADWFWPRIKQGSASFEAESFFEMKKVCYAELMKIQKKYIINLSFCIDIIVQLF